MNRFRYWLLAAALCCMTVLSGCFEYRESITVNEDGTVEIHMLSTINEQVLPFIRNRPEFQFFAITSIGKEAIQKFLPESATIISTDSVSENGWVHGDLQILFADLDSVASVMGQLSEGGRVQYFQDTDGTYVFDRMIFKPDLPKDMPESVIRGFASKQWKEAQLYFELTTPLKVLETNGLAVSDHKIEWVTNFAQIRKLGLNLRARFAPPPKPMGLVGFAVSLLLLAVTRLLSTSSKLRST